MKYNTIALSREQLINWLSQTDKNGTYKDDDASLEFGEPLTTAQLHVAGLYVESGSDLELSEKEAIELKFETAKIFLEGLPGVLPRKILGFKSTSGEKVFVELIGSSELHVIRATVGNSVSEIVQHALLRAIGGTA